MATPAEQINQGFTDAQGVNNSPRDTYIYKDFSLFFGRDRTEYPIDVLFFTGSLYIPTVYCLAILLPRCFMFRFIVVMVVVMFFYRLNNLFLSPKHLY